jgi:hypothetical protein
MEKVGILSIKAKPCTQPGCLKRLIDLFSKINPSGLRRQTPRRLLRLIPLALSLVALSCSLPFRLTGLIDSEATPTATRTPYPSITPSPSTTPTYTLTPSPTRTKFPTATITPSPITPSPTTTSTPFPATLTPGINQITSGQNSWRLTSFEFTHTLKPLGFEVSPSWQGYPLNYDFLLLNFECSTGASLVSLYTNDKDLGVAFIHRPQGYQDVFLRDSQGVKYPITMISACWMAVPAPPEMQKSAYVLLFFKNLPPFEFDLSRPIDIPLGPICFISERDGNPEIYTMKPDGAEQIRLTRLSSIEAQPDWSPDGLRIAFTSNLTGDDEVYVMASDGMYPINLTQNASLDGGPAWSPSGQLIAFHSDRDGNQEIYLMTADGANLHNLTQDALGDDAYPAWSPDGNRLVFQSNRDGNWEIYVIQADGGNLKRLTSTPADEQTPAWSPTTNQIAYWSGRDGVWRLNVMYSDGSQARSLVEFANPGPYPSRPAWSADGRMILFSIARDGNREIYLMNADGSNLRRLTNNDADDYDPCW